MTDFHFLRPLFLLLIPLCWWLVWRLRQNQGSGPWRRFISAGRLPLLLEGGSRQNPLPLVLLALAGSLACLALAGPSWQRLPVPTASDEAPLVILFDLSPSMLARDVPPDRLTRARLKVTDLLRARQDGQTALIAYAGTPHRVSPLTDDARTIESLLPALHPALMPVAGSQVESAMEMALQLLESAGSSNRGHILAVTDGIAPEAQRALGDLLPLGVNLSILGVGSVDGAPIPAGDGNFLRDSRGEILLASLNRSELQTLAQASGGRYIELQPDDRDIEWLLQAIEQPVQAGELLEAGQYDDWHDAGYWLALLLLPLALYAARRGVLLSLAIGFGWLAVAPQPAQAGWWQDLWLTDDQQGARLLERGDAQAAAETFRDPDWSGWANWQAEEFAESALNYQRAEASEYNLGTALARQGQLEPALELLNDFVQNNPNHENARFNRDLAEQLLQQQEQQEQQQQSDQQQAGEQPPEEGNQSEEQAAGDSSEPQQSPDSGESNTGENSGGENETDPQQADGSESGDEPANEEMANSQETGEGDPGDESTESEQLMAQLSEEENLSPASEQWLRSIPDDPAGLLRRKFQYEQQLYRQQQRFLPPSPTPENSRY